MVKADNLEVVGFEPLHRILDGCWLLIVDCFHPTQLIWIWTLRGDLTTTINTEGYTMARSYHSFWFCSNCQGTNLGKNLQQQCQNIYSWSCLYKWHQYFWKCKGWKTSSHSLVFVTTSGERKREKFSLIEYQCWKNYSKEKLICKLKKISFDVISVGTAQQMWQTWPPTRKFFWSSYTNCDKNNSYWQTWS